MSEHQTRACVLTYTRPMNPIQAAMEHCRLKDDLEAARTYGDGWWIQEALGTLTRFVEERYAPQGAAGAPQAGDELAHLVPHLLWILSRPMPVAQRRLKTG
jgi:hypothetical protein